MSGWTYVLDTPLSILLADDDPIFREFAGVNLSAPGVTVECAADGIEALEKLALRRPDIALIDGDMPRMDGFELTSQLRGDPRFSSLPIMMVTGRDDIRSIDRAFKVGATSFVSKPVNWRLLTYQIKYVLRSSGPCRCGHVEAAA